MNHDLSKYMLTNNNIELFNRNIIDFSYKKHNTIKRDDTIKHADTIKDDKSGYNKTEHTNTEHNNNIVFDYSITKDPFFWCLYVIKYGKHKYDSLNNKLLEEENNEKFNNIFNQINKLDDIPGLKEFLKINKITKTTIKNDLTESTTYTGKTSYKLAKVICFLYNINIIVVEDKTYFKALVNSEIYADVDTNVDVDVNVHQDKGNLVISPVTNYNQITINENNEYFVTLNLTENSVKYITEKYYEIHDFDKKIKGIGYYKVDELTEIANKLGINTSIKKKKQDLYNEIKIELKEE
tara:strand:+ start:576 stop:1460 length:885 start_codon:yes stop_codon:yes gene_type:complete